MYINLIKKVFRKRQTRRSSFSRKTNIKNLSKNKHKKLVDEFVITVYFYQKKVQHRLDIIYYIINFIFYLLIERNNVSKYC